MAKRDAPKTSDSKGKTKAQRHSVTTQKNKTYREMRQDALAVRPDDQVSNNCLKKRQERRRNNTPELRREATRRGERQFTPQPDPTIAVEVTTDKGE